MMPTRSRNITYEPTTRPALSPASSTSRSTMRPTWRSTTRPMIPSRPKMKEYPPQSDGDSSRAITTVPAHPVIAETTRPMRSPVAPRATDPAGGGTRGRSARHCLTRGNRERTRPDYHLDTVTGDMGSGTPGRKLIAVNPTGMIGGAEIVLLRLLDAARRAGWEV